MHDQVWCGLNLPFETLWNVGKLAVAVGLVVLVYGSIRKGY